MSLATSSTSSATFDSMPSSTRRAVTKGRRILSEGDSCIISRTGLGPSRAAKVMRALILTSGTDGNAGSSLSIAASSVPQAVRFPPSKYASVRSSRAVTMRSEHGWSACRFRGILNTDPDWIQQWPVLDVADQLLAVPFDALPICSETRLRTRARARSRLGDAERRCPADYCRELVYGLKS